MTDLNTKMKICCICGKEPYTIINLDEYKIIKNDNISITNLNFCKEHSFSAINPKRYNGCYAYNYNMLILIILLFIWTSRIKESNDFPMKKYPIC